MPVAICLLLLAPVIRCADPPGPTPDRQRRLFLARGATTNGGRRSESDKLARMIISQHKSGAWITWTVVFAAIACATLALYAIPFAG
ncbi:MAG TPA: hypothetical protein VFG04_04155 [Planctomycetaceae bacterium]|jgi:hypothetical protein|nr:hypothetical protein [Planctomycetaceae bacterium]